MYGLISRIGAVDGRRDELMTVLIGGVAGMPSCRSYVVAQDNTDSNAIWVTEVWESRELHAASLSLPSVQQAIAKGRPPIREFGEPIETTPVGGHGIG